MSKFTLFLNKRLMTSPLLILLCLASLLRTPLADSNANDKKETDKPKKVKQVGLITLDQYTDLLWRPESGYFKSPGHVRVTLQDALTKKVTVIEADDAEGTQSDNIHVNGKVRVTRPEGLLLGRSLDYRHSDGKGSILDAEAKSANVRLFGDKIEFIDEKNLKAHRANFTTCTRKHPHYHITAREINVDKSKRVTAKNVGFWIGDFRLITLPSIRKSFANSVENPIPLPGYSKNDLLSIHFHDDIVSTPSTFFQYNAILSIKKTPAGTVLYEWDPGPVAEEMLPPRSRKYTSTEPLRTALETSPALFKGLAPETDVRRSSLYAMLTSNGYVYNRRRSDLQLTRLPELGFSFRNLLNRSPLPQGSDKQSPFGIGFFSPANWLINAEAGVGYYYERPTQAEGTRLGTRVDATSPLFRITGPLFIRYGGTVWGNLYGNHNAYALLSPETELSYLLRPNTLLGAAYRYQQDFGKTPFEWDKRDVKHELRLRYGFLGTHWAYDTEIKYDMERLRAYDSIYSIRKRLDCMEVGIAFHTRNQGISLLLNLLPGEVKK